MDEEKMISEDNIHPKEIREPAHYDLMSQMPSLFDDQIYLFKLFHIRIRSL